MSKFVVVAKYKTPGSHSHNIKRDVMVSEVEAFSQREALELAKQTPYVAEIIGISKAMKPSSVIEPYWSWLDQVEVPKPTARVTDQRVRL